MARKNHVKPTTPVVSVGVVRDGLPEVQIDYGPTGLEEIETEVARQFAIALRDHGLTFSVSVDAGDEPANSLLLSELDHTTVSVQHVEAIDRYRLEYQSRRDSYARVVSKSLALEGPMLSGIRLFIDDGMEQPPLPPQNSGAASALLQGFLPFAVSVAKAASAYGSTARREWRDRTLGLSLTVHVYPTAVVMPRRQGGHTAGTSRRAKLWNC